MSVQTIAIGCDHAGFEYKDAIIDLLKSKGVQVHDYGAFSTDSVDYPDFVHPVAKEVLGNKAELGIVICGSGNGVAMTANKYQQIRAAICWNEELAKLARQHNDANMVSIPARFISQEVAISIVEAFIDQAFEGGRHKRRVDKIACC